MELNKRSGIEPGFVRRYDGRNHMGPGSATFIIAPYLSLSDSLSLQKGSRAEYSDAQRVKALSQVLYDYDDDQPSSSLLKPKSKLLQFRPIYVAQVWFLLLDPC